MDKHSLALTRILTGALTFAGVHAAFVATWSTLFHGGDGLAPWFMNSFRSVTVTIVTFAVAGVAVSMRTPTYNFDQRAATAALIATGASIPMILVLFTMPGGPGNLFPIVIFVGWWIMFAGSAAGIAIGWLLRRR